MPKADHDTTTTPTLRPSRRAVLAGGAAALVVTGAAAATAARAAPQAAPMAAGDDAELIALCDRLIAWEAKNEAIYLTIEDDDDEAERQAGLLIPEYKEIRDRFYAIGEAPTSEAGRRAFARAALASAQRDNDGSVILDDGGGLASYLAFGLCHSMTEGVA